MATHKKFRELVPPDVNFDFVGKIRTWVVVSVLLVSASIAMVFVNKEWRGDYLNWTIDFKGGTEMILGFKAPDGKPADVSSGDVRKALGTAGKSGFDVSDISWSYTTAPVLDEQGNVVTPGEEREASGLILRTPEFSAVDEATQETIITDLSSASAGFEVVTARFSGDKIYITSTKPLDFAKASEFIKKYGFELKPWDEKSEANSKIVVQGTSDYKSVVAVRGVGEQYQTLLQASLGDGVVVELVQVDAVGAKAGKQLRNDGIKSLFYAMALIMLYLAFRFDVRFAPGAVVALLHDAILVVGVFAVTWQPVSLTSVAALLTVIGYSVNDSVVIFDRIRENVGRLKDKRFSRVINISLNETMSRTLVTSLTTFVATLMMSIFGTGLVQNFAFAMNAGIIVGVYSSVFVAAPVALAIHNRWFAGMADKGKGAASSSSETGKTVRPKGGDDDEPSSASADNAPKKRGPARRNKKKRRS